MKLLFYRKMRKTILRTFLYVLTLGLLCNITYAQKPDLPILGLGVRDGGVYYQANGDITNPTADWYPDNRIWTVPSRVINDVTKYHEVLVPVFISNRWYNFPQVQYGTISNPKPCPGVKFQEISSFAFKLYYDDRMLQFVDIQKHHPYTEQEAKNLRTTHYYAANRMEYYNPLAYNFNITASNNKATDYFRYFDKYDTAKTIDGTIYYKHAGIGSVVSIAGTASSFHNLDTTPVGETRVLLYLRFRVIPTTTIKTDDVRTSRIYFDPTYICYNGINIAKDRGVALLEDFPVYSADPNYIPFSNMFASATSVYTATNDNMQYFDRNWSAAEKQRQIDQKCVGLQQYGNHSDVNKYDADQYLPGSITMRVMNSYNDFRFTVEDNNSIKNPISRILRDDVDYSLWRLTEPITADSLATKRAAYNNKSERAIIVTTSMTYPATMEDIIVETDQDWLRIRSSHVNDPQSMVGCEDKFGNATNPVRRAYCQRINNLIGATNDYNPFPANTALDVNKPGQWKVWIDCNQEGLAAGEYIGYISFKSPFDRYEVTRIEVKFIVLDNPVEVYNPLPTTTSAAFFTKGITLKITPKNGTDVINTRTLLMGSAALATTNADSLFGEYIRSQRLGMDRFGNPLQFDARFFLDTTVFSPAEKPIATDTVTRRAWRDLAQFGFGDYAHHDGINNSAAMASDNKMARYDSRDIRSNIPGIHSNVHYVKYQYAGNDDFYPVVLEWDASQFVEANTIHLVYMHNGVKQVRDMKSEGTPIGPTTYTFTFTDRSVQEFWIEYSIGLDSRKDLVDNFGTDMIVPYAWNFVSLPLNPVHKYHSYIFPNSLNIPYLFFQNNWQQPADGYLNPGMGYFVKYNSIVDKEFRGSYFNHISKSTFPVKLYAGVGTGVNAKGGWNAIGALSVLVHTDKIAFELFDDGDLADQLYTRNYGVWAYKPNEGYKEVSALYPGKAYFIKVNKNSYLQIDGTGSKSVFELPTAVNNRVAGFDKISVADANQKVANLYAANNVDINKYQLPPVPPTEMFDVRFSKDNYVSNYDASLVNMQGIAYPVSINFENPRANYSVIDPVSGEVYGTIKAGENNNVIINFSKSNSFKLVAEASNETFFVSVNQNPVTTNTAEVSFGIDNDANVSLSIFNSIGTEVANINAGVLNSGVHNRTFDVTNLPAGAYTVRLLANGEARIFMMTIVK